MQDRIVFPIPAISGDLISPSTHNTQHGTSAAALSAARTEPPHRPDGTQGQGAMPRVVTTGGNSENDPDCPETEDETEYVTTRPGRNGWAVAVSHPIPNGKVSPNIAHIDWLAFTLTPPKSWGDSERSKLSALWPSLNRLFGIPSMQQVERVGKWNGYTTVFDLGGHGLLGIGGKRQNGTIHVSLTGSGCAHVSDWQAAQDFLEYVGARITRADLAHDDFEGKDLNMEAAVQWYQDGRFKTGGRNPAHRIEGDWLDAGSPKGRTLYIGRKANGKLCCIYEKGKQLGDAASPWTRAEVRLGGKSRIIPYDVLTRPGHYLAGAYPQALGYLSAIQEKIRTIAKVVNLSLAATIHQARVTVGKVVNLLHTIYQGDDSKVVETLRRDGVPKRLENYADFLPQVLEGGSP